MPEASLLSRRQFMRTSAMVAGGAMLLVACGSDGGASTSLPKNLSLVQRFPGTVLVPGELRLPISLATQKGVLTDNDATLPSTLTGRLVNSDTGEVVAATLSAQKHGNGIPQPYWPFVVTVAEPGIYSLIVDGGPDTGAAVQVVERSSVAIPLVGDSLPPFDTPTTRDARGVNPICTRAEGLCPFHDLTLTEALASGKCVVYLIGTPAYCQTGTCAPALDALIELSRSTGDEVVFVHADVYSDDKAEIVAPAVKSYNLTFEPALFITDATGTLRQRLDAIFDVDEVRNALSALNG